MQMAKQQTIADWMDENEITSDALADAVKYSHGAVTKWRQQVARPTARAEKAIVRAQKRRGWTPFPARLAA